MLPAQAWQGICLQTASLPKEPKDVQRREMISNQAAQHSSIKNLCRVKNIQANVMIGSMGACTAGREDTYVAVDPLLDAKPQNQDVEGFIEDAHHHGLRLQGAALLGEDTGRVR